MNIKHFVALLALSVIGFSLPACNGSSGSGGGKGGNHGDATPDNNAGTTDKEPNTPNKQEPAEPEIKDLAPNSLYGYSMHRVKGSEDDVFYIFASGKGRWVTRGMWYDGYAHYTKTGPNTGTLNFTNMRYDFGATSYIMYDFTGTVEFLSKDEIMYNYTTTSKSNSTSTPPTSSYSHFYLSPL